MKIFKWVSLLVVLVGVLTAVPAGLWYLWKYPRTYEADLRLADDASLPEAKAEYLNRYLTAVSSITGPPRFVFTRPDLDLAKQRTILRGLIKRFEDIAKLEPSSMAYQQGMFQLTGQEIDHQMERISSIFKDAALRQMGWWTYLCYAWLWWIIIGVGGTCALFGFGLDD